MKTRIAMPLVATPAVRRPLALAIAALICVPAHAQEADAAKESNSEEKGSLQEVVIEARLKSAATDVVQERIDQVVAADFLAAEQISRVGDSTVSLALRRLPGVTLVTDQYIYVRGLGERYSSTTLNGAYVPSPDLTRNVIPLDLFPAQIIESLAVQKGYTPEQPAAFGGGNVDIRTRGIPEQFTLGVQIGSAYDSEHSRDRIVYPGGGDDALGTDDGTRALAAGLRSAIDTYQGDISPNGIFRALQRDGQFHTFAEAEAINRQLATGLNRNIDFESKSSNPDLSLEAVLGNKWDLGSSGDWRFGFLGLGDYKNGWRNRDRVNRSVANPDTDVVNVERSTNQVALTGSLNLGLEFTREHKLIATGLYLRNTEDEASLVTGNNFNFQRDSGDQFRNYKIRYEERDLRLYQLRGSHELGEDTLALIGNPGWLSFARDMQLDWYYSKARARTDIPNEINVSAADKVDSQSGALLSTGLRSSASAADFRFTNLLDDVESYGWSLHRPFEIGESFIAKISGGWDYYRKGRSYVQTQFGLGTTSSAATGALIGAPGDVLADSAITDPANGYVLSLGGIGTESYLAGEIIDAYHLSFDTTWRDTWRLAGGVRWEGFKQASVPVDPYQYDPAVGKVPVPQDQLSNLVRAEDGYYPALALTYMRPGFMDARDFQLRFGVSQTTARPDLREVSGATYIDPLTEARVRGNPLLITSELLNLDLRAEWFFAGGDNFTVSAFYKDIKNPIETIEGAGTDDNISLTFINAESAELYGLELEWLKDLAFMEDHLGRWIDGFFLAGNLTYSDSRLRIGQQALNLTNQTRRLTQHSPLVLNFQVGYDAPGGRHSATLVYNMADKRVFFAGRNGAPDAYERPFNSLDVVYTFYATDNLSAKFRVQNMLDEAFEITQGGVTVLEQQRGRTLKVDVSYKF
ncbi:MAG: TonB-dependent receptor plug domain-containing protein [Steroidobacteraceae bacterium]